MSTAGDLFIVANSALAQEASLSSSGFGSDNFSTFPRRRRQSADSEENPADDLLLPSLHIDSVTLDRSPIERRRNSSSTLASRLGLFKCFPQVESSVVLNSNDFLKTKMDAVRLSVQNAHVAMHRNMAGNRQCNPYVTIDVVPEFEDDDIVKKKGRTRTRQRTLFPLFDETFDLVLSPHLDVAKSFLRLCVKDRGVMGEGIFLGEAYVPLHAVVNGNPDLSLQVN